MGRDVFAIRRSPRVNQRHGDMVEVNSVDPHDKGLSVTR